MRKTAVLLTVVLAANGYVLADAPLNSVNAGDLGHSIAVIGPLGKPLGQIITIEGRLVPDSEKHSYWEVNIAQHLFWVDKVDGQKLDRPVKIEVRIRDEKIRQAETMLLTGAQNGGFINGPGEAPQQNDGWHFEVHFTVAEKLPATTRPRDNPTSRPSSPKAAPQ